MALPQITNVEFYNTPEGDVMMKEVDKPAILLEEKNRPTIAYMLSVIRDHYLRRMYGSCKFTPRPP